MRRWHDEEDEDRYRFWSGVLVAIPVCAVLWIMLLAGVIHVLKLLGVMS